MSSTGKESSVADPVAGMRNPAIGGCPEGVLPKDMVEGCFDKGACPFLTIAIGAELCDEDEFDLVSSHVLAAGDDTRSSPGNIEAIGEFVLEEMDLACEEEVEDCMCRGRDGDGRPVRKSSMEKPEEELEERKDVALVEALGRNAAPPLTAEGRGFSSSNGLNTNSRRSSSSAAA